MKKKFRRKNVMIQTTHRFDLWQLHLWIHTPTDLGTSLNPTQSGKSAVSLYITWHSGGSGVYDFSLPFSGELSTCMLYFCMTILDCFSTSLISPWTSSFHLGFYCYCSGLPRISLQSWALDSFSCDSKMVWIFYWVNGLRLFRGSVYY